VSSEEAKKLAADLLGGGMLSLEEENPRFGAQIQANQEQDERILRQREVAQTASEIVGAMAGGGVGGSLIKKAGLRGAAALGTRMAASGLGGAVGAGVLPTQGESRKKEMTEAFVRGAAGELLGPTLRVMGKPLRGTAPARWAVKGANKLSAPLRNYLIPGADETAAVFEGTGVRPTPSQLVDQRLLDEFEAAIQASLLGGARLSGARRGAEREATSLVQDFVHTIRSNHSPEEVGKLVSLALENSGKLQQRAQRGAFSSLYRRYGEGEIDVKVLTKLSQRLESQLSGLKSANSQAAGIIKDVARIGKGEKITLGEAINLRSDLLSLERAAGDVLPGRTQATAAGYARVLDRRIREGLRQQFGPEAVENWRNANKLVASGKGKTGFNNQVMRELIDTADPEMIVDKVVIPKSSSRIRNVRTKVEDAVRKGKADPDTWKAVQGEYLHRVLSDTSVTDPLTGKVNGKALLDQLTTFGDEALREVFPGGSYVQLKTLARALATSQRPEKSGFGGVAMRMVQFGAIIQIATDPLGSFGLADEESEYQRDTAAGAILLGPLALSYVLTNPKAARYLTTGLNSPPGSMLAKRAFGQLASHLDEIVPFGSAATNVPDYTPAPPNITEVK